MRFAWDPEKNRSNWRKHRVLFETAAEGFRDPYALTVPERLVGDEQRWQTLCMSGAHVLAVSHTISEEDGDEVIRIISARKANRSERHRYAEGT